MKSRPFDPEVLSEDLPRAVRDQMARDMKDKRMLDIETVHTTSEGEEVVFDFFMDESDGTQRLFGFAGPWIDSLANSYVLFIDELHISLHPQLVKFLAQLFHSNKTNPKNAQLVSVRA